MISPHFFYAWTFAVYTFFDIEAQKRSRVTKLGAQTQHRVVLRSVPPSASKQSEITCARDKCVVFHNIVQAISGSTGTCTKSPGEKIIAIPYTNRNNIDMIRLVMLHIPIHRIKTWDKVCFVDTDL